MQQSLKVAETSLSAIGYECLTLPDFDAAIEVIGSSRRFDLLLTDLHLGDGRLGSDLIPVFLDRNPSASAILASGRIADVATTPATRVTRLAKPIDPAKLSGALATEWGK